MAESSSKQQELTCTVCKHVVVGKPVSCLVCDAIYHGGCASKYNGTLVGRTNYVCKNCDSEYFSEIRHLMTSNCVSEETKNVLILLVKIIESKDEIISAKNQYIKILQKKVAKLEHRDN